MNADTGHSLSAVPYRDPDEINLLEYLYVLVKRKRLIIGVTVVGILAGYAVALIKGPVFVADVLISAKEPDAQKTPNLGSLGPLASIMTSQVILGLNPALERIETVLGTRKFNAQLIEEYGLLAEIYRVFWPRIYRKYYDKTTSQWKPPFQPSLNEVAAYMGKKVFKREIRKTDKTMSISVQTRDSLFSHRLMTVCVEYLNRYVREGIQEDSQSNVAYLDSTLTRVADPLLREKIQALIAVEIEKMMIVSKEAFQVVDPVVTYRNYRHRKLYPLIFGVVVFTLSVIGIVFGHAVSGAEKLPEDRQYLEGIKRELRRW